MLLLAFRDRTLSTVWAVSYLVVGGLGVYLHALVPLALPEAVVDSDQFSFLAAKVALLMVGGIGITALSGIAWTVAGYVVAEVAVVSAGLQTGVSLHPDVPCLIVLLATVCIIPIVNPVTRRLARAQPRVHRAARDDRLAALRYRVEVKAAALMHDTVLNHLAAIADSPRETLDPLLLDQVRRDAESLAGEEWLAEPTTEVTARTRLDWQHSGLFAAIQESRLLGLEVEATGDLSAVGRLDREGSIALGLAMKQCLVNVLKHSGTRYAEVAVYASGSELSVMVVDNGRGFSVAATGADRLGLRTSVRKRIESVGGSVTVWSTPGRGTSIMIRVPVRGEAPDALPHTEQGRPT
jgi:signal transduction histidine kinase